MKTIAPLNPIVMNNYQFAINERIIVKDLPGEGTITHRWKMGRTRWYSIRICQMEKYAWCIDRREKELARVVDRGSAMSESIDLTNLPKRKQRVAITERQLREGDLEKRIAELEQQLAEAQAKAELWEKVRPYFKLSYYWRNSEFDGFSFQIVIPRKDGDTIEDAVRRLV